LKFLNIILVSYKTKQIKAKQSKAKQSKAKQSKAKQLSYNLQAWHLK